MKQSCLVSYMRYGLRSFAALHLLVCWLVSLWKQHQVMNNYPGSSHWNIPRVLTNGTCALKRWCSWSEQVHGLKHIGEACIHCRKWSSEVARETCKEKSQKDVEVIHATPSPENRNKFHVYRKELKFLVSVLDGCRNIFCRHLGHHWSCGGQLGISPFPALVEDLGKRKVNSVGMGEGKLVHSRQKVLLWGP